jgi:hypothetical protein
LFGNAGPAPVGAVCAVAAHAKNAGSRTAVLRNVDRM